MKYLSEYKIGEWIDEGQFADNYGQHSFYCSLCKHHVIEYNISKYKYCPNCGGRMVYLNDRISTALDIYNYILCSNDKYEILRYINSKYLVEDGVLNE